MRSVISRPGSLRSTFTSWMRSSSRASSTQLVVERRVERDRDAVVARDRPAVEADALDEHLVRLEHVAVDLEAAAVELLELAALRAARARRGAPAPSFGPSTGRFGFTAAPTPATSPNSTSLTRSSSAISSACAVRDGRRARDDEAPQRLAQLEPRRRARLAAELDDARAPRRSRRAARGRARRARATARGAPTPARPGTRFRQRWSARNGITGEIDAQRLHERVPERPERGLVERVEAPARAADVPVRDVVDERVERARSRRR